MTNPISELIKWIDNHGGDFSPLECPSQILCALRSFSPRIIINLHGGIVQDVQSDLVEVSVFVVDHDIEGCDDDELIAYVDTDDRAKQAYVIPHYCDSITSETDNDCLRVVNEYLKG